MEELMWSLNNVFFLSRNESLKWDKKSENLARNVY